MDIKKVVTISLFIVASNAFSQTIYVPYSYKCTKGENQKAICIETENPNFPQKVIVPYVQWPYGKYIKVHPSMVRCSTRPLPAAVSYWEHNLGALNFQIYSLINLKKGNSTSWQSDNGSFNCFINWNSSSSHICDLVLPN